MVLEGTGWLEFKGGPQELTISPEGAYFGSLTNAPYWREGWKRQRYEWVLILAAAFYHRAFQFCIARSMVFALDVRTCNNISREAYFWEGDVISHQGGTQGASINSALFEILKREQESCAPLPETCQWVVESRACGGCEAAKSWGLSFNSVNLCVSAV